jgi:hypothetical protein
VARRPDILGEPLLVIGRQIAMDEGRDRIDLLALDKAGNLVVIELERDLVGGSADLQALRYVALVAQWSHDDIRRQAEGEPIMLTVVRIAQGPHRGRDPGCGQPVRVAHGEP